MLAALALAARGVAAFERLGDRRDVLRRIAAAPAGNVDQAVLRKVSEVAGHVAGPRSKPVSDSGFGSPALG